MPQIPPIDFRDGDALEPWHINYILSFIRRWNKFDVSPPLAFDNLPMSAPHLSAMIDGGDLVPIKLTADLGVGSFTAPSNADCILLLEYQTGPAFTTTGAPPATVYNPFATAVPSGKFAWAAWRGPWLYLVVADC